MSELKLVVDVKATLGEGPCWSPIDQLFYWVDINQMKLHIHDPKTESNRFIQLPQKVGTAVPRASGGFIIALEKGFFSLDLETEALTAIVDPKQAQMLIVLMMVNVMLPDNYRLVP